MIQIRFEQENQRSAAYDGEVLVGFCTVQMADNCWTIHHTEVDPAYGGQGIARKLVLCVEERAKKIGVEIIPLCSYAKRILG